MSCWTTCLKWIVFIFNLNLWLSGLGILGLAIFLRVDPSTTKFFDAGYSSMYRYLAATYVLMGVGILMAFIGFLGCCGALRSSRCLLGTFFSFLVVVFVAEIAAGIVAYVHKDHLTRTYIESGFSEIVRTEYNKDKSRASYFDLLQSELECCGATSSSDWFQSDWHGGNGDIGSDSSKEYWVPFSCCKKAFRADATCLTNDTLGIPQTLNTPNTTLINDQGCASKLMDVIEANKGVVIGIGVSLVVSQVIGLILSIILCCTIKPQRYGYKS